MVSLLLSASVVEAADSEYPATDFQPTVVFQDTDYKHTGAAPSSSSSSAKSGSTGKVSAADPAYPAANFKPEVLFSDDEYKHTEGKVTRSATSKQSASSDSSASSASSSTSTESTESASSSDDGDLDLMLGLSILAIAGFLFYKKSVPACGKKAPAKKAAAQQSARRKPAQVVSNDGTVSSVSKYLAGKAGAEPSSVEKYLEEKSTSVSSVSKYVAKQRISARVAAVTGVEKYLNDKG